jgi:RNA polymerase sigma-70 factor (ECF subfamily)
VWLPEPVEGWPEREAEAPAEHGPEARYSRLESASYAFLLALEALTPAQRAILLLRDVFDCTVRETAEAVAMSEANVKTTHHRARRVMSDYEAKRRPPDEALGAEVREMLGRMVACIASMDLDAARTVFAADATALSDGGGLAFAAKKPVKGPDKIARMYLKLSQNASEQARFEIRDVNGLPALFIEDPYPKPPNARRSLVRIELDHDGKVREIHSIVAPPKLARLRPIGRS